jgi:hypothetical protein
MVTGSYLSFKNVKSSGVVNQEGNELSLESVFLMIFLSQLFCEVFELSEQLSRPLLSSVLKFL